MINKQSEVQNKILAGLDAIADPVRQTMGPRGNNVLFQNEVGSAVLSNDGVTIAKQVKSDNPTEQMVIDVVKESALKTNMEAGDGTSTSILLAQVLVKEGLKLINQGYNPMHLKNEFLVMGNEIKKNLRKQAIKVKNNSDIRKIAMVSSNNDSEIADNIVETIQVVGEDGMVFIEPSHKQNTEVEKNTGFFFKSGIFNQELLVNPSIFSVFYKDTPVFITDKNIYHQEEAESILRPAILAKEESIVVVAKKFSGLATNVFIANHNAGKIKVLLIEDSNGQMRDLSTYLNIDIYTDSSGSLVNELTMEDFGRADSVFSDNQKTLFTPTAINPDTEILVKELKSLLDENPEDDELRERISSLTNGMVTIKVGGATPIETRERIYRYEDSINATKSALKYGYLIGGGISLLKSIPSYIKPTLWETIKAFVLAIFNKTTLIKTYALFCSASVRQLAENNGVPVNKMLRKINNSKEFGFGYNAVTGEYGKLDDVIDPLKVTELAVDNSISIANAILTAGYLITLNNK